MSVLLRHPVFRLLLSFWWVPVLAGGLFALGGARPGQFWSTAVVGLAYPLFLAGAAGATLLSIRSAGQKEHARHRAARHDFVCPDCLHAGGFHFACPACGHALEDAAVWTRGAFGAECPHCAQEVLPRDPAGNPPLARCGECGATHAAKAVHERQVTVVAALRGSDLEALASEPAPRRGEAGGLHFLEWSRPDRSLIALDLSQVIQRGGTLPRSHAAGRVRGLWLRDADALSLGQAVDLFLSFSGLSEAETHGLEVSVEAPSLDPAAQRLLEARFGRVRYGVAPGTYVRELLGPETGAEGRPA